MGQRTDHFVLHYRVLEKVGRGGMGVVYKAEDTRLGRLVALKFLPSATGAEDLPVPGERPAFSTPDPAALERFRREARAASALNHPHICIVYDIGEYEGHPFLVMEYLEGKTLKERLGEEYSLVPLHITEVLNLAVQIADGLQAAHEKGIIHRDIKPANIFVTAQQQVKILDFGLAKLQGSGARIHGPEDVGAGLDPSRAAQEAALNAVKGPPLHRSPGAPRGVHLEEAPAVAAECGPLTRAGVALGTLFYMSPEQRRGEQLDARTDLYSLGLVLDEMASEWQSTENATVPAAGESLNQASQPEFNLNAELARGLQAIIAKALEEDRTARYQSAAEMKADLERLGQKTEPGRPELGPTTSWWRWALAALVILAGMAAGGRYFYTRRTRMLAGKSSIVLADFSNSTEDPVFDGTLRQGLAVALEQSPYLNVVSGARIHETLAYMGKPAETELPPELARQVCQREGGQVVLAGSIAQVGSAYVLGLSATDCNTGNILAETQTTATGKADVLDAVSDSASYIRSKLGESLQSLKQYDTPLEEATTPSLEALQAFTLGWKVLDEKSGYTASIPFFQRAIELDPNFASAYQELGVAYANLGENQLASANLRKAYELRGQVSERERLHILAHYYDLVTGDLEKARQTYQVWATTYPQDATAHGSLAASDTMLGQYDRALVEDREALRLEPHDRTWTANSMNDYLALGDLKGARAVYDKALQQNLDSPYLRFQRYDLAFLEQDRAAMAAQVAWAQGQPGMEDVLLGYESDTEAYYGLLARARELSRQAVESAQRARQLETAGAWQADAALREALFGNGAEARAGVAAAQGLSRGRDVSAASALALALAGDGPGAAQLADELARRLPNDTAVNANYLPAIHGAIAVGAGDPAKALEVLRAAAPYELGFPTVSSIALNLYPVYVRGLADVALHHGSEAATEFQKILDHPGIVVNEPIGALAYLGLGRALALAGDASQARQAYSHFLALWKEADRRIPVLREAREEYEKLGAGG